MLNNKALLVVVLAAVSLSWNVLSVNNNNAVGVQAQEVAASAHAHAHAHAHSRADLGGRQLKKSKAPKDDPPTKDTKSSKSRKSKSSKSTKSTVMEKLSADKEGLKTAKYSDAKFPFSGDKDMPCVSPDQSTIPGKYNIPWCYDTEDHFQALSCTPYHYFPGTNFADSPNTIDGCSGSIPLGIASQVDNSDAGVWVEHFDGENNEYYVFHACDGAGIQSDCAGDIFYVERFGVRYNYEGDDLYVRDGQVIEDDGTPDGSIGKLQTWKPDGICEKQWYDFNGGKWETRTFCKFVHPGTNTIYDDYSGGWWSNSLNAGYDFEDGKYGDKDMAQFSREGVCNSLFSGNWSPNYGQTDLCEQIVNIPDVGFNGEHPFGQSNGGPNYGKKFSFTLYAFAASGLSSWDEGYDSNAFSYPHIADYNRKVYVDNEVGEGGQPWYVEVYFGTVVSENEIHMLKWKSDQYGNLDWVRIDNMNPIILYKVQNEKDRSRTGVPW